MALMNYKQTADFLGVAIGTLYARVHKKMIPFKRLGTRLVRFDREELEQWLTARSVADSRLESEFPPAKVEASK